MNVTQNAAGASRKPVGDDQAQKVIVTTIRITTSVICILQIT